MPHNQHNPHKNNLKQNIKAKSQFLKAFLNDKNVASLTPTALASVRKICKAMDLSNDLIIVEFGPGDGVFTKYLLEHITPGTRVIAFETNKIFAAELEALANPRLTILHERAENITDALKKIGIGTVDYVLSGIPLSFLKPASRRQLLQDIAHVLRPEGKAIIYQFSPFLFPYIQKIFPHRKYSFVWHNIPPLTVFEAWKHSTFHKGDNTSKITTSLSS